MKNKLQQKYISRPSFLPKLRLSKSIARESIKPSLYVPSNLNAEKKARIIRKRRRNHSVADFLSPKVDFINDENNRRLEIHKNRKVQTKIHSFFKKQPVFVPNRIKSDSARLVVLIDKVYMQQAQKQQEEYINFTNHLPTIDQTEKPQRLCSPRFLK